MPMTKTKEIEKINNFLVNNEKIEFNSKNYEKIEFIYGIAIKEIKHKLEILKEEYKMFYDYDLIDHINERIKSKESISKKMTKKGIDFTYSKMIENINDIAGVRVICPLKKDIYTIRKLITNLPGIKILKEKDYIDYKYRKQKYLIDLDWQGINANSKEKVKQKYISFYIYKINLFWGMPSGYERGLTRFCGFVKIRVFVGISVFTRVLVYRTFVHF